MSLEQDIQTVARTVAARKLDDAWEWWDEYPDVGEQDWERIVEAIGDYVTGPTVEDFEDAYTLLSARAEEAA